MHGERRVLQQLRVHRTGRQKGGVVGNSLGSLGSSAWGLVASAPAANRGLVHPDPEGDSETKRGWSTPPAGSKACVASSEVQRHFSRCTC